jgi:TonB family protein
MSERDRGLSDGLPERWVRRAARQAPPDLAERLEEEWLADLICRERYLSRVGFALSCCWAVLRIARDHAAAPVASSATAAAGVGTAVVYARHDWSFLSRRTLVLIFILALHVLLIYCFAVGLARTIVMATETSLAGFVDVAKPRDVLTPPPPPRPDLVHPRFDIPAPDLTVNVPDAERQITQPPPQPEVRRIDSSPGTATVIRVAGGPDRSFPDTDDYYPTNARRLGQSGSSVVRVCVDPRGRLTAVPTLAQSSGIRSLDAGALELAKAGTGHYRPTTEDGRPVSSCYAFRITFNLKD